MPFKLDYRSANAQILHSLTPLSRRLTRKPASDTDSRPTSRRQQTLKLQHTFCECQLNSQSLNIPKPLSFLNLMI